MAGSKASLAFDGFIFDGSAISDGSPIVECVSTGATSYGGATLTLLRSTIRNGTGLGLVTSGRCVLVADAVLVEGNKGGGVQLDMTDLADQHPRRRQRLERVKRRRLRHLVAG